MALRKPPEQIFVGREEQLQRLEEILHSVMEGDGRMVMLVGEPGIGKTRTAQELAASAEEQGVISLWGRCYEGQQMPPYWPWVQAINTYIRSVEREKLRNDLGGKASILSDVFEELKEVLPDLKPPPETIDPESARFRLFDALTVFLKRISRSHPFIIVLDDLHWSDTPSLAYLRFLARELADSHLLLVGTYRDVELSRKHPLQQTIADLTREQLYERILLRGLAREDVEAFLKLISSAEDATKLADDVFEVTEGNPLFVTEIVRLLADSNRDNSEEKQDTKITIPEGIRAVIGRRLDGLPPGSDEVLSIAAVVGREFDLSLLNELITDESQERLLTLLDNAITAGIIEEIPGEVGGYRFTHSMIMETLINELSLTRRVQLHAQIAEVLERLYGDESDKHAAEIAGHFIAAEAILGTEKMAYYCLRAGEQALSAHAHEDAVLLFRKGIDAKVKQPMDELHADLLFGFARAQISMGNSEGVEENFTRAFDYYLSEHNISKAVDVATYPVKRSLWKTGWQMVSLSERASEYVEKGSYDEARLATTRIYSQGAGYKIAAKNLEEAIKTARNHDDLVLEARLLNHWGSIDQVFDRYHEGLDRLKRMIEIASDIGDREIEYDVNVRIVFVTVELGNPEAARVHIAAALKIAKALKERISIARCHRWSAEVSRLTGAWNDLFRDYDQAMNLNPLRPVAFTLPLIKTQAAFELGRDEGPTLLKRYIESLGDDLSPSDLSSKKKYRNI